MNDKYRSYLLSPTWAEIKLDLISNRGQRCERCQKKTKYLQVHHLTYERIFKEEPKDLLLLCRKCHENEHGITKSIKKTKNKKRVVKKEKPKKQAKIFTPRTTKKNPLEKVLNRQKGGRYKTLMAFNTAYRSAVRRCQRTRIPYLHLLENKAN
jgi:hypothetical protein